MPDLSRREALKLATVIGVDAMGCAHRPGRGRSQGNPETVEDRI